MEHGIGLELGEDQSAAPFSDMLDHRPSHDVRWTGEVRLVAVKVHSGFELFVMVDYRHSD